MIARFLALCASLFAGAASAMTPQPIWDGAPYDLYTGTYAGAPVVYFVGALRPSPDAHVWRSDGTAAGTVDIAPSAPFRLATRDAGGLYFMSGCDLFASDGSAAGTAPLRSFGACGNTLGLANAALDDTAIVYGYDAGAYFVRAGAAEIHQDVPGLYELDVGSHAAWFTYTPPPTLERLAGRFEGAARTVTGLPFNDGAGDRYPHRSRAFDRGFCFKATWSHIFELWCALDTDASPRHITPAESPDGIFLRDDVNLIPYGSRMLFVDGYFNVWVSDGTNAGTRILASNAVYNCIAVDRDRAFFVTADYLNGVVAVWITDGTPEHTTSILTTNVSIGLTCDSFNAPKPAPRIGDTTFLTLSNGLLATDGTTPGTSYVLDDAIPPKPIVASKIAAVGSTLLLIANGAGGAQQLMALPMTLSADGFE